MSETTEAPGKFTISATELAVLQSVPDLLQQRDALLEACEGLLDMVDKDCTPRNLLRVRYAKAQAAIARAKGEA